MATGKSRFQFQSRGNRRSRRGVSHVVPFWVTSLALLLTSEVQRPAIAGADSAIALEGALASEADDSTGATFETFGALALAESALPGVSSGRSAPSAEQITALRLAIGKHRVRVRGRFGIVEIAKPFLDAAGVGSMVPLPRGRQALVILPGTPESPALPDVLTWDVIDEIEVGESQWRSGLAWGAGVWFLASLVVYPLSYWLLAYSAEYPSAAMLLVETLGASMGLGAAIGSGSNNWKVLYLAPGYVPPLDDSEPLQRRKPSKSRTTATTP
jgi:hypothetical protein